MIKKISTGLISIDKDLKGRFVTEKIIGRIEKVIVKYGNQSALDTILKIDSNDGENLMSVEGCKDGIWYPRNWDVQNQIYSGNNIAAEGQNTMNAERWLVMGFLTIEFTASIMEDFIQDIQIIYEDLSEDEDPLFEKEEGAGDSPVTSETPGVFSPSYGGRKGKKRRKQYVKDFLKTNINDITKSEDQQNDILNKADDLRRFIEEGLFNRKFQGLSKSMSELIKEFILRAVSKGYSMERVMNYMERKGVPKKQASAIFRTEVHELRNRSREWSYEQLPGEHKFKWIGPGDHRRTETCARITERTKDGVSIEKLKRIIQEETQNAKDRGELPANYEARDYTPHFNCRHVFVKKY